MNKCLSFLEVISVQYSQSHNHELIKVVDLKYGTALQHCSVLMAVDAEIICATDFSHTEDESFYEQKAGDL